jgi:hydrogenase 3 maturation protease
MSNLLTAEILKELTHQEGLTVILTIGNPLRSDDGIGPYIASLLEDTKDLKIIDAGYTPENCIDEVTALGPKRIIIIDAADFEGLPGEVRLVDKEHIPETSLSTHMISLKVIASLLEEDTKAQIKFLGIQPITVEFKEGLSDEIKETADEIVAAIKEGFHHA